MVIKAKIATIIKDTYGYRVTFTGRRDVFVPINLRTIDRAQALVYAETWADRVKDNTGES